MSQVCGVYCGSEGNRPEGVHYGFGETALNRTEKEHEVEVLREKFLGAKALIITDYRGLSVAELSELRRDFRQEGTEYRVVKNTLAKRAVAGTNLEPLGAYLTGPSGVAINEKDPIAPAKTLNKFMKVNTKLTIKGGFLEGKTITVDEVKALAYLPSRNEMIATLLGTLQAPQTGLVTVLSGILRKFLATLDAIRTAKSHKS